MYSKDKPEFEMMSAEGNLEKLSTEQREVWDFFYNCEDDIKPIDKSQIDPVRLKKYLPYIWMADIIYDDNGKMIDLQYRLIGTKLTPIYGERTGENIIRDTSETSSQKEFPMAFQRIQKSLSLILELERPVFTNTYYLEKHKQHLNVSGLTFPVYNNSDKINMIFGYVDLSRSKIHS